MGAVFSPGERRLLLVAAAGHFLTHFYMVLLPVVALAVAAAPGRAFALTPGESLGLTFPAYLLYGLGAVPAGLLTDRWHARGMLVLCLAGLGFAALAAALAPSPPFMAFAFALLGLAASIYHPAGLAVLSRTVRARGRALGVNGLCGNLGIAAAPVTAALLSDAWGWRTALALLAVPGLSAGVAAACLLPRAAAAPPRRSLPAAEPGARYGLYLLLLCGALLVGGLAYRAALTAAPSLFVERVTLTGRPLALPAGDGPLAPGNLMLSLAVLLGCAGQLLGGRLADRHDLRLVYLAFYAATLPAAFLCARLTELPLFVAMAAYVFFTLGLQPVENSLLSRLTPDRWRSTAFGLKFVLTFGVGALGVRLTAGVLGKTGSAAPVFLYVSALVLLLLPLLGLLYLVSRRPVPRLLQRRPGEVPPA